MLDQWQRLTQRSRPISEYISRFNEFLSRCDLQENEHVILSRFRTGLKEDLQRELLLREVSTLQHDYQMVQEIDRYAIMPTRRFDPPSKPTPPARPPPTQHGQSFNSGQHGSPSPFVNKDKALMSSQKGMCFKCQQPGHFAAQCPKQSLVIDDRKMKRKKREICKGKRTILQPLNM